MNLSKHTKQKGIIMFNTNTLPKFFSRNLHKMEVVEMDDQGTIVDRWFSLEPKDTLAGRNMYRAYSSVINRAANGGEPLV